MQINSTQQFPIDIERLKKALESETFLVPPGLSREEKMEFILSVANNKENKGK